MLEIERVPIPEESIFEKKELLDDRFGLVLHTLGLLALEHEESGVFCEELSRLKAINTSEFLRPGSIQHDPPEYPFRKGDNSILNIMRSMGRSMREPKLDKSLGENGWNEWLPLLKPIPDRSASKALRSWLQEILKRNPAIQPLGRNTSLRDLSAAVCASLGVPEVPPDKPRILFNLLQNVVVIDAQEAAATNKPMRETNSYMEWLVRQHWLVEQHYANTRRCNVQGPTPRPTDDAALTYFEDAMAYEEQRSSTTMSPSAFGQMCDGFLHQRRQLLHRLERSVAMVCDAVRPEIIPPELCGQVGSLDIRYGRHDYNGNQFKALVFNPWAPRSSPGLDLKRG